MKINESKLKKQMKTILIPRGTLIYLKGMQTKLRKEILGTSKKTEKFLNQ